MAKWIKFHLNEGKSVDNDQVLDSDVLDDAHKPQNAITSSLSTEKYYTKPVMPETLSSTSYGLGWRLGHYRGTRYLYIFRLAC